MLPAAPALNVPIDVQADGRPHAPRRHQAGHRRAEGQLDAATSSTSPGSAPIVLSDFGIDPPSVGGFVEVDGDGVFEVQLTFVRA